ncbi:MAG: hypothetical protein ABW007_19525 [Chitinophagaceae bacterium]
MNIRNLRLVRYKKFVGIDLSLNRTGIVILQVPETDICSRNAKVTTRIIDSKKLRGFERWTVINNTISDIVNDCEFAAIEHYAMHGKGRAGLPLAEIGGIVRNTMFTALGRDFVMVSPTVVKSFIGEGNADKQDMINRVKTWFGFDTEDDNLADAFVLAKIAQYSNASGKFTLDAENCPLAKFQVQMVYAIPEFMKKIGF